MRDDGGRCPLYAEVRGACSRFQTQPDSLVTYVAVSAISAICAYDASNEDSLLFTCPIFPLLGYIIWLDASLGVTLRFTPCRYQQRMGALGTALDTGLESF